VRSTLLIDFHLPDYVIQILLCQGISNVFAIKLSSKQESSLAKRASKLCSNAPALTIEIGDYGGEGVVATAKASNEPNSEASTTEDSLHNSVSSV
jgi:hypothetical protein